MAPVVVATLLVSVSCGSNTGTVSLVNKAREPISRATLTMSWGDTLEVTNLDPAELATVKYRVREGNYRIEVAFGSGKHLNSDTVYVASGFDYHDQVTVTESEIRLIHSPVDSR
jgi:hypothetical protein